jgi:hypothetical protein
LPDWSAGVTKDEAGGVQSGGTAKDATAHFDDGETARLVDRARTALIECHRSLIRATDEKVLVDAICRIAVGVAGYSLVWVGFAETDERKTVRPVARYGEAAAYLDEISVTWGCRRARTRPDGERHPNRPALFGT